MSRPVVSGSPPPVARAVFVATPAKEAGGRPTGHERSPTTVAACAIGRDGPVSDVPGGGGLRTGPAFPAG